MLCLLPTSDKIKTPLIQWTTDYSGSTATHVVNLRNNSESITAMKEENKATTGEGHCGWMRFTYQNDPALIPLKKKKNPHNVGVNF